MRSGILATEGQQPAKHFAEQAIAVLAFWLLLLTIAGELLMPQLMRLLGHVLGAGEDPIGEAAVEFVVAFQSPAFAVVLHVPHR